MEKQKQISSQTKDSSKPQLVFSTHHILYNPVESQCRQVAKYSMRHKYKTVMTKLYSRWLIQERDLRGLTQEQMAERLSISTFGYTKQEHGKDCCGSLTLALFCLYCCSDPDRFWAEMKEAFEKAKEDEYASV